MKWIALCICIVLVGGVGGGAGGGMFGGDKTKTRAAKEAANMLKPFEIRHSKTFYPMMKSFFLKKINYESCRTPNC